MRRNEGNVDRVIRVVVAAAAAGGAVAVGPGSPAGIALFVVAGVMLATAAVGFCPLYALLGVDTCPATRG
jgi:hypothetical protein